MKGQLIVFVNGKSQFNRVVCVYEALEVFNWAKEMYRNYTAIHYLDGNIKGEAKNGFTLSDIEIEYKPLKKGDI